MPGVCPGPLDDVHLQVAVVRGQVDDPDCLPNITSSKEAANDSLRHCFPTQQLSCLLNV